MTLTADHLSDRLARLRIEFGTLALYPSEFVYNGQSYRVVTDAQRDGHAHTTIRRIYTQVQVLDLLANHLNRHPTDHELMDASNRFGS
jgi:hypothetical protein